MSISVTNFVVFVFVLSNLVSAELQMKSASVEWTWKANIYNNKNDMDRFCSYF